MGFLSSLLGLPRELVITDVTRMQGEKLCVAGLSGRETVRLHDPQPSAPVLATIGGLHPGTVLSARWQPAQRYRRPHREDSRWKVTEVQKKGRLKPAELHTRLLAVSYQDVRLAFGDPKYFGGRGNPAFPPDKGDRSIATIVARTVRVYKDGEGLRADVTDKHDQWRSLPVEDIGLRSHFLRCSDCVRRGELEANEALVRIGLGRPFQPGAGAEYGCFAQVNLILPSGDAAHFFEGEPT